MTFTTSYSEILKLVERIDPIDYGKTRNFVDGSVTRLSPYISRGVISTKEVFQSVMRRGYDPEQIEKFLQELAWRDYWQQLWVAMGNEINRDLKRPQPNVLNHGMANAILEKSTGIKAIDDGIASFYETGYLHNHLRMYVASIACNLGGSHWLTPAKWMYYHLLDADWASNALSWQWVSGANAGKKYFANQDNINKYCYTDQKGTFLDVEYHEFDDFSVPKELQDLTIPILKTPLPEKRPIEVNPSKATLLYNFYNLDPKWHADDVFNRILILAPSVFQTYPISQKSLDFMLQLAHNVPGIQIYVGEFNELKDEYGLNDFIFKEHPLNSYSGTEESRDWMFNVKGYYPSFFAFWKKCKKELTYWNQPVLFEA
jgi:deoxyribodipyrimidine photo-lyase